MIKLYQIKDNCIGVQQSIQYYQCNKFNEIFCQFQQIKVNNIAQKLQKT